MTVSRSRPRAGAHDWNAVAGGGSRAMPRRVAAVGRATILCVFAGLLTAACAPMPTAGLSSSLTEGTERIPTEVAFVPLLSVSVENYGRSRPAFPGALEVRFDADGILGVSQVALELVVTPESEMMTELIADRLAAGGFTVTDVPVDVIEGDDGPIRLDQLRIGSDLLDDLANRYGTRALIIGNGFFLSDSRGSGLVRIAALHLSVVDIAERRVLAAVRLPYSSDGRDPPQVADEVSASLVHMAGLDGNGHLR